MHLQGTTFRHLQSATFRHLQGTTFRHSAHALIARTLVQSWERQPVPSAAGRGAPQSAVACGSCLRYTATKEQQNRAQERCPRHFEHAHPEKYRVCDWLGLRKFACSAQHSIHHFQKEISASSCSTSTHGRCWCVASARLPFRNKHLERQLNHVTYKVKPGQF